MKRFAGHGIISIAWTPACAGATTCFDERQLESQDDKDHRGCRPGGGRDPDDVRFAVAKASKNS